MKAVFTRILDPQVLAVAVVNDAVGDWAAYVGAVPGICHAKELGAVVDRGTKLAKEIAIVLFPTLAKKYEWRE